MKLLTDGDLNLWIAESVREKQLNQIRLQYGSTLRLSIGALSPFFVKESEMFEGELDIIIQTDRWELFSSKQLITDSAQVTRLIAEKEVADLLIGCEFLEILDQGKWTDLQFSNGFRFECGHTSNGPQYDEYNTAIVFDMPDGSLVHKYWGGMSVNDGSFTSGKRARYESSLS